MNHSRSRPIGAVAMLAMVAVLAPPVAASGTDAAPPKPTDSPAQELRAVYTSESGMDRPSGVTYDPAAGELLVTGDHGAGSKVLRFTPGRDEADKEAVRPGMDDGANAAFDPRANRLDASDPERLPEVSDARGATYAPDGTRYVLDADSGSVVRTAPGGATDAITLDGLADQQLRGLAYNPQDDLLYVAEEDGSRLHAVDETGSVVSTRDLSDVDVRDLQAMTFGDSADNTDDPENQNLYIADAGDEEWLGRVAEVTLAEPVVLPMAAFSATLVNSHDLSALDPPSSDSAGAAYQPSQDRIIMSDSEINETTYYEGINLFSLERDGTYVEGGTSQPESDEPTGAAIDSSTGWLYTSDDDDRTVYETRGPGPDGVYGTDDDPAPRPIRTGQYGNSDTEGVAFDSQRGHLLVVDGVGAEVYRYDAGPNGNFGDSDDVVTHFDVGGYGAKDPEGIEYDDERDTIAVLDDSTSTIYEMDENGSLLNVVDVSASNGQNVAGLAIAPAADDSGARHYYLVDRGKDPGLTSDPDAIDGAMYEMAAELDDISNRPPAVDVGPERMADVGEPITLDATVDDPDGNPLTYSWTRVSGPGTVSFGSPNAVSTTATFPVAGRYVLQLSASDGTATGSGRLVVNAYGPTDVRSWSIRIDTGTDDAHQRKVANGFVESNSADIELGRNVPTNDYETVAGVRFTDVPIPKGAEVVSAHVQFTTDEVTTDPAAYTIHGQDADNPPTFVHGSGGDIMSRPLTTESVDWAPPPWDVVGEAEADQRTSELRPIVQAIVNREGWTKGNSMVFVIEGDNTGRRTAMAIDRLATGAPVLRLEYRENVEAVNTAPTVDAGADQTVTLPDGVTLDGTASDDGLPDPPAVLTTSWSKVSGPGEVTFGDASALDTTAAFAEPGSYVLELTADDGELTATDRVAITVNPATGDPGDPQDPGTGPGADCGDVGPNACGQLVDHKAQLADSGVRDLGRQVGSASRVGGGAMMQFARGTVYWSRGTGAHAVWGAIGRKYERMGGPSSVLGFPVGDEQSAGVPGGRMSRFARGRIYWSKSTGAHEVHGAILRKYLRMGGPGSVLGLPASDERNAPVAGRAKVSRFAKGRIYWSKSTGAHEVHGAILKRYLFRGGPKAWGLPVTDERRDGSARFSRFQKASVYWSRRTGPRIVYGAIRARYLRMGGHTSWLGLPKREEWAVRGGRQAAFEHGWIYWNRSPKYTRVFRR